MPGGGDTGETIVLAWIQGYFTVEDLGLHTLKGVAEPQQVYSSKSSG